MASYRRGSSTALLPRYRPRMLQSIVLGLAMLGVLPGVARAGPQGVAKSLRVAFVPEAPFSPNVSAGATAREMPPGTIAPSQLLLPIVRLWDEIGSPRLLPQIGTVTITAPLRSRR